jgi:hypothetical protein
MDDVQVGELQFILSTLLQSHKYLEYNVIPFLDFFGCVEFGADERGWDSKG